MLRMISMIFIFAVAHVGCKPIAFNSPSGKKSSDAQAASQDSDGKSDETIALEPVPIAGAFLACFVDRHIAPSVLTTLTDEVPVGCQTFEDPEYKKVKANPGLAIISAELRGLVQKTLTVLPLEDHPRWLWATLIPQAALKGQLILEVQDPSGQRIKTRIELQDLVPPGLANSEGRFLLRMKGSALCLSGNPVWTWDANHILPLTENMFTTDCSLAIPIRLETFETGLRVRTLNPRPNPCDLENWTDCEDSCIDLEDYGRGLHFSLFACTKSVEAQRHNFIATSKGAFRIRTNGRFLTVPDGKALAAVDGGVEFELVTAR